MTMRKNDPQHHLPTKQRVGRTGAQTSLPTARAGSTSAAKENLARPDSTFDALSTEAPQPVVAVRHEVWASELDPDAQPDHRSA